MALSTSTMRGLIRYLPGGRKGAAIGRLVVYPETTAPVYGNHIRPTAEPTGTAVKGDWYFDSTANCFMQHTGSAWEQVGATPGGNLAVTGTLSATDNVTFSKNSGTITVGTTNPVVLTHGTNSLTLATGDTLAMDVATVASTLGVTGVATLNNASTVFASDSTDITIGTTSPVHLTFSANALTVASGDTLAVTTADKFTIGGIIVPQYFYINHEVLLHATRTEWDIFPCIDAFEVVAIRYAPSILQGGAITGTLVKSAGTTIPANGTTPLHTANAIDFDGDLWTVQTIALTATGADLIFAAGNRLGLDLSGALTVGQGVINIKCKRV